MIGCLQVNEEQIISGCPIDGAISVRVDSRFGSYRWFVYITTPLLRDASWILILHCDPCEIFMNYSWTIHELFMNHVHEQFMNNSWTLNGSSWTCSWTTEFLNHQSSWTTRVHEPPEFMNHQSSWTTRVHEPPEFMN